MTRLTNLPWPGAAAKLELRGAHECATPSSAVDRRGAPLHPPKPIRAIRLRPGGLCGCSTCLADEQREEEHKNQALAAIVYQAGVEQLRLAALERVPAFLDAFRVAS